VLFASIEHTDAVHSKILAVSEDRIQGFVREPFSEAVAEHAIDFRFQVVQERAVKTPFDMLEILAGCSALQRGPSKSLLCEDKFSGLSRPVWPRDEVPLDAVLLDAVPLDAVLPDEVVLDEAAGPPPAGAGCGLSSALYAVGLSPMMLSMFRSSVPYIAVLLLLAVLGRFEHPTMLKKDALAVIQSNAAAGEEPWPRRNAAASDATIAPITCATR
jgi:hypothetical protein